MGYAKSTEATEREMFLSYMFTNSIRLTDGTIVYCESNNPNAPKDAANNCWTPDKSKWPQLANLVTEARNTHRIEAEDIRRHGCGLPGYENVCAARLTWVLASTASAEVFAAALRAGDTRIFNWYGTPASLGVAEAKAAADARGALAAAELSLPGGNLTVVEQDRMRTYARQIRAGIAAQLRRR